MRLFPVSGWLAGVAGVAMLGLSVASGTTAPSATAQAGSAASAAEDDCAVREYAMGIRYQQSGNAAAAQRQAWLLARSRLKAILAGGDAGPRPAIVTDLDETVLDNSPLLARDTIACHDYTTWDTWSDWEQHGHPRLTPGARQFLNYADRREVAVYYISDRLQENKPDTLATLTDLGLPQVRKSHVLLYGPTKQERRDIVADGHDIVLLLGDSLPDFHDDFDGASAG